MSLTIASSPSPESVEEWDNIVEASRKEKLIYELTSGDTLREYLVQAAHGADSFNFLRRVLLDSPGGKVWNSGWAYQRPERIAVILTLIKNGLPTVGA
jgi:hypothetical protein